MSIIGFDLNDLYITLKKHDEDILKQFHDETLTDELYLFYAINSDIMSNALGMVMNILSNNEESIGVDNNARVLLESFVILKMLKCGAISNSQLKIFRNQYAIVEYLSFKKRLDKNKESQEYELIKKRYDNAINFMCDYYKCGKKDLKKNQLNDPLYFLRKNINDKIDFTTLLYKYPIFNERELLIYEFYSIMIHPRFEVNKEIEEGIQITRKRYNKVVLNYVFNYLKESGLLIIDNNANTFDDDFTNNDLLINNVKNIKLLDSVFKQIENEFCYFKNGYDGYSLFYYKNANYLLKDMMICESLGYNEQVISKFKSFMEMTAVYKEINSINNYEEFFVIKEGFVCSSRLQLDENFNSMNLNKDDKLSCKRLYEKYYKDKYNLNFYDEFEKNMRTNSLYFLNGNKIKNYRKLVDKVVKDIFNNDEEEIMNLYDLSNRMNHSSGYNFNSSNDLPNIYSHKMICTVCKIILNQLLCSLIVLESNGKKIKNFKAIETFFELIANDEVKAIKEIEKKYKNLII